MLVAEKALNIVIILLLPKLSLSSALLKHNNITQNRLILFRTIHDTTKYNIFVLPHPNEKVQIDSFIVELLSIYKKEMISESSKNYSFLPNTR